MGPDLAAGLPLLLAVALATSRLAGLPAAYLLQAAALYALLAALVVRHAPDALPGRGLGPANRITLGRAALALAIMPLALRPGPLGAPVYWWIIGVSTAAMVLDGFDGWAARRTGTATPFGARFDVELDAALLMALSVLVWRSGAAGPWVLLIGGCATCSSRQAGHGPRCGGRCRPAGGARQSPWSRAWRCSSRWDRSSRRGWRPGDGRRARAAGVVVRRRRALAAAACAGRRVIH